MISVRINVVTKLRAQVLLIFIEKLNKFRRIFSQKLPQDSKLITKKYDCSCKSNNL